MPLPARFSQADIARAMREIEKRKGDWRLRIWPDGAIEIFRGDQPEATPKKPLEAREGYRL